MRRLMQLVELLQTSSGGLPPVKLDPGDGGEPKGGQYWVHGRNRIAIDGDFATMVFRFPQEFGLSRAQVLQQIRHLASSAEMAQMIERDVQAFWQREDTNAHKSAFEKSYVAGFHGGRLVGSNILFASGWCYVTYAIDKMRIWVPKAHLRDALASLGKQFPLMQLEEFDVLLFDGLWLAGGSVQSPKLSGAQQTVSFRRDDFPGIAGMFNAVMDWARTGKMPQQSWFYVSIKLADLDRIRAEGLVAQGPTHFYVGNWTERNAYIINFLPESPFTRARYRQETMVRFVPEAAPAGTEINRNDNAHTMVLYSKQPFRIAPEQLQTKVAGFWQPLVNR